MRSTNLLPRIVLTVFAVAPDAAALAMGMVREADDLPVPHQVPVDVVPPLLRGDLHQGELRLLRSLGVHQTHEIGYPVHMGVHAHRRDAHRVGTHTGGGLPPDHRQGCQDIRILRHASAEVVAEDPAAFHDGLCLLVGEPCGTDQFRDLPGIRIGYRVYGIVLMEQVVRRLPGVVVPGALG